MNEILTQTTWSFPDIERLEGKHVLVTRLNPDTDVDDLYDASHATEEYKLLWTYMHNGPFPDKKSMHAWLLTLKNRQEHCFYVVLSKEHRKKVGMCAVMNISPTDGRAEHHKRRE